MSVEQPVGWGSLLLESSRTVVQPSHWWPSIRHPIEALRRAVGDGPLMALVVLFGLNAVDELDRTGFGILIPNIRDDLGLSNAGILSLVAISLLIAFLLQLPIAVAADRYPRVPIAIAGAIAWGVFSLFTGLANGALMLVIARSGAGIGRAVVDPTHNSLLADYYAVDRRSSVYSIHRGANVLGQFAGPLLAGGLAAATGSWRTPFFVFVIPTVVFAALALRLREPVRGGQERKAAGGDEAMIALAEPQASFEEAFRLCNEIPSLRRLWYSVPFLSVSLIGFVSLAGILYEQTYNLDELQRGYLAAAVEPFQFVGLAVGAAMGTKLFMRDPSLVFKFLRVVAIVSGVFALAFALAPTVWLTVVANIALTSCLAIILPGLLASLSVAIPARARAVGFAIASYWAIPGLLVLPLIGWLTDRYSARVGMLVMVPVLVVGGLIVSTAASTIQGDIADVWTGSLARAEDARERAEGRAKLLVVRDLHVSYDNLRVLTGLSMEVGGGGGGGTARHQRRRQVDAAGGDRRHGARRPGGGDLRWARHHARPAPSDRPPGPGRDARGQGHLPQPYRCRESAYRRVDAALGSPQPEASHRGGVCAVPGFGRPDGRTGGQPLWRAAATTGPGHGTARQASIADD
jgi:MFS family permease